MRRAVLTLTCMVLAASARAQTSPSPGTPAAPDTTAAPPPVPQATSTPPDYPRGRISGHVFGDLYYNLQGTPIHGYNAAGSDTGKVNIDNSAAKQIGRDLNGIQIRRVYFQLDNDLTVRVATRFRLEADSKSLTSDAKIGVALRNAYVQVKSLYPRSDLFVGLIPTPVWENSEAFWGYRSIEKTIADFRGLASSQDLGFSLKGFADPNHHVGYLLMLGNGNGQKPEDNRYKRMYASLPFRWSTLIVEPYADYENFAGGLDRSTYKLFAGYEYKRYALGVEAVDRVQHRPIGNQEPRGVSIFARGNNGSTFGAFARADFWQSDHRVPNRVDSRLYIAGIDWQPIRDVHFMPNVEAMQYVAQGTAIKPAHDEVQARVTFYYLFSRPQTP
jgi:hypothetical protein